MRMLGAICCRPTKLPTALTVRAPNLFRQRLTFYQVFSHTLFKLQITPQLQNVKSRLSQITVELGLKPLKSSV